ncbi:hypothetical protein [Circoviridae sp.]|nr:hypothetical protein [Circoviridae sp.]UOF77498.1 hypothetical protein [Cressdnaviricota sp.]UOF82196.1 hypothetical protein [Cressdnaviricota sp.]UOF83116.1 hypothetical protein [Cressdnaviricota sp.]
MPKVMLICMAPQGALVLYVKLLKCPGLTLKLYLMLTLVNLSLVQILLISLLMKKTQKLFISLLKLFMLKVNILILACILK